MQFPVILANNRIWFGLVFGVPCRCRDLSGPMTDNDVGDKESVAGAGGGGIGLNETVFGVVVWDTCAVYYYWPICSLVVLL